MNKTGSVTLKYLIDHFKNRKRKKYLSELRTLRKSGDDLLSADEKKRFDQILDDLKNTPDPAAAVSKAAAEMAKFKLPWSCSSLRNLLDLLLVVGAVAFGIRGLYFQPFRIPTSSMQPTLYGIHYQEKDAPGTAVMSKVPDLIRPLLFANTRAKAVVSTPGRVDAETFTAGKSSLFFDNTVFRLGGKNYSLPGNPLQVADYTRLDADKLYTAGENLADGFVSMGDHLFVERFSLYLSPPKRGEIMVFNTSGLYDSAGVSLESESGYYYIKRLAALPGDTVKIVNNNLYIRCAGEKNFRHAAELSERFKKIYSGKGGYHGHLSGMGRIDISMGMEYTVPADHYFMLGDNSRFSKDSRFFGAVPRKNLVGRAFVVFWPFSRRWGSIDTKEPLDVPTGEPGMGTFPSMYKQ